MEASKFTEEQVGFALKQNELHFILDSEDAMGAGYPSETFRVMQKHEQRHFGGYNTQRLVLVA